MDVFSHAIWGRHLTYGKINWKLAAIIGMLPDLLAFIPGGIVSTMNGEGRTRVDENTVTSDFPDIAWQIYQITHSLFWSTILFLLLWFSLYFWMKKNGPNAILLPKNKIFSKEYTPFKATVYLMLPWFFHILLDIPSHTLKFFPTPFLMPISDYMIDGVPWGITGPGAWIWWLNLGALIGVGYFIWSKQRRDTDSNRHA